VTNRHILHIDLDAFFASVEVKRNPSLAGKPVIVGGNGARGVVAACTYEARSYGVRSAMGSVEAQRLCPHAIFVNGHHADYAAESEAVFAIVRDVTPTVEMLSLDEAFCDITPALRRLGSPETIAGDLRRRIQDECGLAASVGIAPTKMVAKLASEAAKPQVGPPGSSPRPGAGVVVLADTEVLPFLRPLPVRALWGVGPATHARLDRLGVRTVGDLADTPMPSLLSALGARQAAHLSALAHGIDERAPESNRAAKTIGQEETFANDRLDLDALHIDLVRITDAAVRRLRESHTTTRHITLKVKYATFVSLTRSRTLDSATDDLHTIRNIAEDLLRTVDLDPGVRLLGVSLGRLGDQGSEQMSLDDLFHESVDLDESPEVDPELRSRAALAVDEIRARFGAGAVGPGTLVDGGSLRVRGDAENPWGPGKEEPS